MLRERNGDSALRNERIANWVLATLPPSTTSLSS